MYWRGNFFLKDHFIQFMQMTFCRDSYWYQLWKSNIDINRCQANSINFKSITIDIWYLNVKWQMWPYYYMLNNSTWCQIDLKNCNAKNSCEHIHWHVLFSHLVFTKTWILTDSNINRKNTRHIRRGDYIILVCIINKIAKINFQQFWKTIHF